MKTNKWYYNNRCLSLRAIKPQLHPPESGVQLQLQQFPISKILQNQMKHVIYSEITKMMGSYIYKYMTNFRICLSIVHKKIN